MFSGESTTYGYNSLGQPASYSEQKNGAVKLAESYSYDLYGNLSQKNLTGGTTAAYAYTYSDDPEMRLKGMSFGNVREEIWYDALDRLSQKTIYVDNVKVTDKVFGYVNSHHATTIPANIWYKGKDFATNKYVASYEYYTATGQMKKQTVFGKDITYNYADGRLRKETNALLNKSYETNCNDGGNILFKSARNYPDDSSSSDYKHLTYEGDKLTKYGNETFVYDNMGNPTTYRSKPATWKGRQLLTFNGNTFTYDGRGRRASKNSLTFLYDAEGNLVKQSNGLEFYYDFEGIAACKYGGNTYIYITDGLGNVIALIDSNGNEVVQYWYDAWGNHKVVDSNGNAITNANHIGNLNPFRYRGYYYDRETGLYFLQTRYYDPEIGRFLNRDSVNYADPGTINGLNLYAYCLNNPIAYTDPYGTTEWWEWLTLGLLTAIAITAVIAGTVLSCGATTPGLIGLLGSTLSGLGTGFLTGAAANIVTQGISNNWDFNQIDPMQAIKSGGIGAIIGGVGGIMSYAVGFFGGQFGYSFGNYISKLSINGLNVGKGLEYLGGTNMIVSLFSGVGSISGAVLGTYIANDGMNKLFGNYESPSSNMANAVKGEIDNKIVNLIYKFFRWVL